MTRLTRLRLLVGLIMALPLATLAQVGSGHAAGTSPTLLNGQTASGAPSLSQIGDQHVIVVLRNQHQDLTGPTTIGVRTSAIQADQTAIVTQLQQVHASHVIQLHLINAVAATTSSAEVAQLQANPQVLAVVPDRTMSLPTLPREQATAASSATAAATPACTSTPQLEPEALQLTNTAFSDPNVPQAQNLVTGKGVTVAVMADSLDPNNPDLIRPDGSHVVTSYVNLGGRASTDSTSGGEMFGDASSVAAQGRYVYDAYQYAASPHSGCPITIRGMAPGASLMVLDTSGPQFAFSTFALGIQYAVDHGANVISESLGLNVYPDTGADPWALANEAAVADGVPVVESTGDAATANTLGWPGTSPGTIAVGATSSLRLYQQIGYPGTPGGTGGWISNNIATFSSGGIAQSGKKTVDVVAPGQNGWALCSTNVNIYTDCTNFNNQPTPIEDFGGTSESAPLTAGEVALIIQAYRQTHGGITPSPLLVKQIVKSSATDLDLPSDEQGAGLINSLAAVKMAMSIPDSHGTPAKQGNGLLYSIPATGGQDPTTDLLSAKGLPGTPESFTVHVTNVGASSQTVSPTLRTLAAPFGRQAFGVTLNPSTSTQFIDGLGRPSYYQTQLVPVPAGTEHLSAAIAWQVAGQPNSIARMTLYDPQGNIVLYSNPQGPGSGYGNLEVRDPQPGLWKAVIWAVKGGTAYTGLVRLNVTYQRFASAGTVTPSSVSLAPGQSQDFTVQTSLPTQAGDENADVVLTGQTAGATGSTQASVVPVILRAMVPVNAAGGSFSGILTGGNGRGAAENNAPGQTLTFEFQVPSGMRDLDLRFSLNDSNYNLQGLLVDPNGLPQDLQTTATAFNQGGQPTSFTNTMQFFRLNPEAGDWKFVLWINARSSGAQTAIPFSATIGFNQVSVQASGLPNSASTTIPAGSAVTVPITVRNTGNETVSYFADPRLAASTALLLGAGDVALPFYPFVIVPTQSTQLSFYAESHDPSVPMVVDMYDTNGTGPAGAEISPLIGSVAFTASDGNHANLATTTAPEVPFGEWVGEAAEAGPFPSSGAPASNAFLEAFVITKPFDTDVTASTGDLWSILTAGSSAAYTPLTLDAGQTGTMTLTIKPSAAKGTVVHGFVYIDTAQPTINSYFAAGGGEELIALPYSYTVG